MKLTPAQRKALKQISEGDAFHVHPTVQAALVRRGLCDWANTLTAKGQAELEVAA